MKEEFFCCCNGLPSAILISAYFGKYSHCTVKWVNMFRRCDIIFRKYSCTVQKLKIDRKPFEYHNETFVPMSPAIRHDVQAMIGSHFDRYQQPANLTHEIHILKLAF